MNAPAANPPSPLDEVIARLSALHPVKIDLSLDYGPPGKAGRVAAGSESMVLAPGVERETSFEYKTAAAGILGVTLTPHDSFPGDDHAELGIGSAKFLLDDAALFAIEVGVVKTDALGEGLPEIVRGP